MASASPGRPVALAVTADAESRMAEKLAAPRRRNDGCVLFHEARLPQVHVCPRLDSQISTSQPACIHREDPGRLITMTGNLVRVGPPDLVTASRRSRPSAVAQPRGLLAGFGYCRRARMPPICRQPRATRRSPGIHSRANRPSPPRGRNCTDEARAWLTDEMSMRSIRRRFHDHRRETGERIRRPTCIAARHRYRKQFSTLSAANLDRPFPPFAVDLDTQIVSDQLRQLERPLGRRKFSDPKSTLRALRAHKGDTVLGHGTLAASRLSDIVIKAALMFSYAND